MLQHWHKRDTIGFLPLTCYTLRALQFIFALTIIGIYSPDLTNSTRTHTRAHSAWIFADVAACLSALTCLIHCFVTVTRVVWCLLDLVLAVLWAAQVGVFAGIYLGGDGGGQMEEEDVGVTNDVGRMRAGVGVGVVNLVLWFGTAVLGCMWCCVARRGKAVDSDEVDGGDDQRDVMGHNIEKEAFEKPTKGSKGTHGYSSVGREHSMEKSPGDLDLKGETPKGSLSRPPSYESVLNKVWINIEKGLV